jgi:putative tryptophan/tyrosine transport system substrate-binding protein
MSDVRRREFIAALGGAAATWPVAARAQQPAVPVVGFLHPSSADVSGNRLRGFRVGLKETGFVEGENVAIQYRWGENQIDRLPALAAELVRQGVAVIVAGTTDVAIAARAATTTIPIVFIAGENPVTLGLVGSLARPSGNLTGINFFVTELAAKRLEFLRELVPGISRIAVLVDPAMKSAESTLRDVDAAARAMGLQLQIHNASTNHEIDAAFARFVRERPHALFVSSGPAFIDRRIQLAPLTAFHRLPATYSVRENAEAGGLMSYGPSLTDVYRQVGVYCGRILKGAQPTDLPVEQASKFELVINLQTARMLGLDVPAPLLALADEVFE